MIIYSGKIDGAFYGFNDCAVFKMKNAHTGCSHSINTGIIMPITPMLLLKKKTKELS